MLHRIETRFKEGFRDASAEGVKKTVQANLSLRLTEVKMVYIYTIDADISEKEAKILGKNLFVDTISQDYGINTSLAQNFDWSIEVGFKPGLTDNVGRTAKQAVEETLKTKLKPEDAVYTSKQYLFSGSLSRENMESIARNILANNLIEQWLIQDKETFERDKKYLDIPKVVSSRAPNVSNINLNVSDEELIKISKERKLALNLIEMKKIKNYFSRSEVIEDRKKVGLGADPTDAELEVLAQTWSEHCKHKIFNAKISYKDEKGEIHVIDSIFDTYIKKSTKKLQEELSWIVSTLWDNSGVMKFNDDWLLAIKCETHNSPSNEEPYGGAITGIVGVYRDPMGTGKACKLVYGSYGFCTGDPFYSGSLKPKIHPKRLLAGVRRGVEHGGNKSGIPTPYGITFFDKGYMGKPVIYVSAGGLIPAKVGGEEGFKKHIDSGDLIVMCGGRVGIDGIHGATESSMEAGDWISPSHVQIGDPFTQKKMHDFLNEARDKMLFKGITDNGAGGLSSSIGEMARDSNGFELYLDKVPLKYAGLDPWQIFVSESQERMSLSISPDKIDEFKELAKKHDTEVSVLGKFIDSGKFYATYDEQTVTYMDMDFVHEGVPQMELEAEWQTPEIRGLREPVLDDIENHGLFLEQMLSRINICSKEYIIRQFDHEVQGTSVIKHLVGKKSDVHSDAVVLRPVLQSENGIAISAGINPKYSQIDTYHMSSYCLDEAIRRIIAVGGSLKQIGLNDNFCWPSPLVSDVNPDAKYKLAQLVRANQALYDYTLAFKTPCISGKDSMSIDGTLRDDDGNAQRISGLPTLQFSAVGKIEDVKKCVTMDVKKPDDLVYVLGKTKNELGASEYYEMRGELGVNIPKVEAESAVKLYNALSSAVEKGLAASIHGCYKGGLAIALAQTSFAGGYGLRLDLRKIPADNLKNEVLLYSESASRFVVTISPENKGRFEEIMNGNVYGEIGKVTEDKNLCIIGINGEEIMKADISQLKQVYKKTFKEF